MIESIQWPYLPPTLRNAPEIFHRFHGAVKTRIIQRQKMLWSKIIGAGFTVDGIQSIWPETTNLEFFGMCCCGNGFRGYSLKDLNLRELEAVDIWLTRHIPDLELAHDSTQLIKQERPGLGLIHVSELSPLALQAITQLATKLDWPSIEPFMLPEHALLLIERLKNVVDSDEAFPKGKWATIQHLEQLFATNMWRD